MGHFSVFVVLISVPHGSAVLLRIHLKTVLVWTHPVIGSCGGHRWILVVLNRDICCRGKHTTCRRSQETWILLFEVVWGFPVGFPPPLAFIFFSLIEEVSSLLIYRFTFSYMSSQFVNLFSSCVFTPWGRIGGILNSWSQTVLSTCLHCIKCTFCYFANSSVKLVK